MADNGSAPQRILIICGNTFGPRMSSPGIRARHMAEVLSAALPESRVTLAIPHGSEPIGDPATLPYRVTHFSPMKVPRLIFEHDIVIANEYPAVAMAAFPWKKFILDYYTIYLLEWLENSRDTLLTRPRKRQFYMATQQRLVRLQLPFADFLLTANDRQKDYYTGAMIALGLVDPRAYDRDPGLHDLIEPVPHGVRDDPLVHSGKRRLRGAYAGIGEHDHVIIWNGGILQWYDPLTLLRALAKVVERRDDVKLVFVGGAYPGLGTMGLGKRFQETIELAKELDLYNRHVFFDLSWVPYEQIKDYMLEADIAACTYFDNLETHFSFRTRFVDVFWAELPLICTHGDVLADVVRERGLGVVVPEGDVDAVAEAIERLIADRDFYEQCRRNIRENNKRMSWERSFEPVVRFCREPRSTALAKWRRVGILAGAAVEWMASRGIGVWVR